MCSNLLIYSGFSPTSLEFVPSFNLQPFLFSLHLWPNVGALYRFVGYQTKWGERSFYKEPIPLEFRDRLTMTKEHVMVCESNRQRHPSSIASSPSASACYRRSEPHITILFPVLRLTLEPRSMLVFAWLNTSLEETPVTTPQPASGLFQ